MSRKRTARTNLETSLGTWPDSQAWDGLATMTKLKNLIERRVVLPLQEQERARKHGLTHVGEERSEATRPLGQSLTCRRKPRYGSACFRTAHPWCRRRCQNDTKVS